MSDLKKLFLILGGIFVAAIIAIVAFMPAESKDWSMKTADEKELAYWACRRSDMADLKEYGSPRTIPECAALYRERALFGGFTNGPRPETPPAPTATGTVGETAKPVAKTQKAHKIKESAQNNCPLYPSDGFYCNGTEQLPVTAKAPECDPAYPGQCVQKMDRLHPARTADKTTPVVTAAEKEAQCERDYNVHPWYVVSEDGIKSLDAHAACTAASSN